MTHSANISSETVLQLSLGIPKANVPPGKIERFCERWNIVKLGIFGSVVGENFGPDSDIDFLFRMDSNFEYTYDDLFDMEKELGEICGRKVDFVNWELIEKGRNHIRKRLIFGSMEVIYARR